ncbi:uncharacterized protein AB675_805 [Cyphellophora attinorum]|uniref:Uncharacterized protein n=1 Tax=Cyphellophora attinorum TaxID=1664694 RepID=A0A0N1I1L7_9EURO|nr:uncharacterized protein AB675_805 [Phialophora attinorum]KPI45803.1 hypothetical protein AB675_805 [Phialophora attinorum]
MDAVNTPALRRSKRRAAEAVSPLSPIHKPDIVHTSSTPTKRGSKRVRFSTGSDDATGNMSLAPGSTGLTPAVSKHRLATPKSRRRVSTPAPKRSVSTPVVLPPSSPLIEGELQIVPLRQALDSRMQRRIARNGMAEEVEAYYRDKKQDKQQVKDMQAQIDAKDAELKALKFKVADTAKPTRSLSPVREEAETSPTLDPRIADVEEELSLLRRSFQEFEEANIPSLADDDEGIFGGSDDWIDVPRDSSSGPRSESGDTIQIYEDHDSVQHPSTTRLSSINDAQDATTMGLELASARQAKKSFLQSSFGRRSLDASDIQFADSPSKPTAHVSSPMPKVNGDVLAMLNKQLKAANAHADDTELALQALEGEVRALSSGFTDDQDALTALKALADHFRSVRLELERLLPGEIPIGLTANHALLPELTKKLKDALGQLAQRTSELQNLRNQEKTLRGNFDQTTIACHAAQKKADELEKSFDELNETLLNERLRASRAEGERNQIDRDNTTLRCSLDSYRQEVSRLEGLIVTMEAEHQLALKDMRSQNDEKITELEAKAAAETTGRRAAEDSAVSRLRKIQELEDKLQQAKEHAAEVESSLHQEIDNLDSRVSSSSKALAVAEQEVNRLRKLLKKVEKKYRDEVFRGEEVVRETREDIMNAAARFMARSKSHRRTSKVSLANWELESDDLQMDEAGLPMTPSSTVRFADYSEVRDLVSSDFDEEEVAESDDEYVPGSVETVRGKKRSVPLTPAQTLGGKRKSRRKYDSGIGIDDGMSDDEGDLDDSGLATPDLSSEADIEMDSRSRMKF